MSEKEARKAAEEAQDNAELSDEELEQASGGTGLVIMTGPVLTSPQTCPILTGPVTSGDCPKTTVSTTGGGGG